MATVLLIASLLLSWYFFAQKRILGRYGQSETLRSKFLGYLLEWSATLAVVLLFYHILLLMLAASWRWFTVTDLMKLEQWLNASQKFIARYKPEWGTWIAVLIVLYFFSHLWILFLGRDTPFRVFRKTKRAVHYLSTLAFLFASFTLLGFHPGDAETTLEIHLQKMRTDYGALQQELGTALAGATINQTYNKVFKALPDSGAIPGILNDSMNEGSRLRNAYADAATKYAIHDYKIGNLVRQNEEFRKLLENVGRIEPHPTRVGPVIIQEVTPPETVTYEKISRARERVREYMERSRPTLLRLLNKPGGKEIVLELPKGAIDHMAELFSPAAETFPVLKPVLDVLKSTFNDSIKQELKSKLDNLTDSVIERPNQLESWLPATAREITDSTTVRVTPEETRQFSHEVRALQQQVAEMRAASGRLSQNVGIAEARRNQQQTTRRNVADTARLRNFRTRPVEPKYPLEPQHPIETRSPLEPRFPIEPRTPVEPRITVEPRIPIEPFNPGSQPSFPSGGGGGGGSSSYVQCICNTYVNGALVSSVPIPEGAVCGGQICGSPRKR